MTARLALAAVFTLAAAVPAAPVPKSLKARLPGKLDTARFKPAYTAAPLSQVIEDFADGTGLRFVGEMPAGSPVTLRTNREYTSGEFTDLLNERLEPDRLMLIRHGGTFYLHPADRPIDPERIDAVSADELTAVVKWRMEPIGLPGWANGQPAGGVGAARPGLPGWGAVPVLEEPPPRARGRTEVVRHVVRLPAGVKANEILPQVKSLLSPLGAVEAGNSDGELVVTDRVANIRTVHNLVNERRDRKVAVEWSGRTARPDGVRRWAVGPRLAPARLRPRPTRRTAHSTSDANSEA
jgi:type II secretory pathway component GspD/PulD (secretin)